MFVFEMINFCEMFKKNNDICMSKTTSISDMKDFLTFDDMVKKLEEAEYNALTFTESEKEFAEQFFSYTNFYSFTIYRKQLPKNEDITYSFSDCYQVYKFNSFIREKLSKFTGVIELMLKATLVKSVCQNYEGTLLKKGECYLDPSIYNTQEVSEDILKMLSNRILESKAISISHHKNKKNWKFPLWVIIPELTFGETTRFLSSLNEEYRNNWVKDSFFSLNRVNSKIHGEEYISKIFSWFSTAWALRNICAHYSRLYGSNFNTATPSFFSDDYKKIKKYGKKKEDNKDLFAYMLAIKNILQFHSIETIQEWNDFIDELAMKFNKNKKTLLERRIGFTENWKEMLLIK